MSKSFINIYNALSHPNKTLYQHIKEIIWFAEELKKQGFYFNEKYLRILSFFHDLGKMYVGWQEYLKLGRDKIKHSGPSSVLFFSIVHNRELIEKMKLKEAIKELNIDLELSEGEIKILTYLILVHHSDLKLLRAGDRTTNHYENFFTKFDEWCKFLQKYNLLEAYVNSITTKINIKNTEEFINAYASFKIADRLSGSFHRNLNREEIPKILYKFGIIDIDFNLNEENLRELLKKISDKIDEKRLKDQISFLENKVNILLAPTGFGKTLFSIFKGIKNKKMLIALPTITATKQFLKRTGKIINEIGYFSDVVGTYFYFYNPFKSEEEDENLILNEYFLSRYLLKPIMLTTVDQLLLTYLHTKEYYIKKFALQNRMLIIDEIHLLTPKMLYFLLQFLKDYRSFFKDFVLMSATFPEFLIELVKSELEIEEDKIIKLYNYYPKNRIWIELLDEDFKIKKEKKEKLFERIYEKLKEITKNKKPKIIVLFNTVNNAQEFYNYLKEKKEDWNILLFHSRYIYKHRKEIEKELLKTSKVEKLNKPFILVATQIVEVSLDIDFDYLITELAPLPELIQRFGRVFRNRREDELPPKEANIYIFGFLEESKKIYDEAIVKESFKIIKDFKGVVDEEKLIRKLDEEKEYGEIYSKEFEEAKNEYGKLVNEWLNNRANRFYYIFVEEDEEAIEKISELLNIRDSLNALVFVNENDLDEKETKKYEKLLNNLKESKKARNFLEFFKSKLFLREFLLPIPFYYIRPLLDKDMLKNEKIPKIPPGVYNREIGLNVKKLQEVLQARVSEKIIL